MKTNYLFKTALLLLVAMVAGVSTAWAIDIPTTTGSYINWSNATCTQCAAENTSDSDGGNLGNTQLSGSIVPVASFTIVNSTKQNYLLSFKSSLKDGTAEWNVTITNSSSEEVLNENFHIANTTQFTNYDNIHTYALNDLAADTYTLTFTAISHTDGSYYGNLKYLGFYNVPTMVSGTAFDLNQETNSYVTYTNNSMKYESGNQNVGFIKNGSYATYFFENTTAQEYVMTMGISRSNTGNMNVVITDMGTGESELSKDITIPNVTSYATCGIGLPTMRKGIKKMVLTFTSDHSNYICNYNKLTFTTPATYDDCPGSISLGKGIYQGDGRMWNNNNNGKVGFLNSSAQAQYIVNCQAAGNYNLKMNVSDAQTNGGTATITATNVGTGASTTITTATIGKTTGEIILNNFTLDKGTYLFAFTFTPADSYVCDYNALSLVLTSGITLSDSEKSYNFSPFNSKNVDVTLTRTITANNWSTICLPFAMTSEQLTAAFGSGVKVAELSSGTAETLNFSTVTETVANKPYAIKVASDFTSATISGVTIESATPTQSITNWDFVGTYSEVSGLDSGNYYFKNNKLWQATGSQKMKPFRGYFHYTGGDAAPSLNFIIDGETTGIDDVKRETITNSGEFYDLSGRRVAQPTKGLYIVNGKKYVVK